MEDDQVLVKGIVNLQKNVTYVTSVITSIKISRLIKKARSDQE